MFLIHNKITIPSTLKKFHQVFADHNFKAYLVGGAVRDIFLNKEASDWDVATNATPQDVMGMFKVVIPTGFEHGTVTVHFLGEEIEVTTFRTETGYSDGRHPDKINYAATIEEDLSRRDFTMNAIAVDLSDGSIVDPFNGQKDIKNKIIRTVGNPHERFMEDGLRPIRALRFASKLDFTIENDTYAEIFKEDIKNKILSISIERFRDEFEKILMSKKPSVGLKLMEETGVLKDFIPEFSICRNCIQSDYRGFHQFDVMDHLFYACDGAPQNNLKVRLAALFHDIGKPVTKKIIESLDNQTPENITFYNHEAAGEKITRNILIRLRFSNETVNAVCHLVKEHMFHYETNWSDAAVRRFIVRATPEALDDLFDLRLADMYGMHNEPVDVRYSESVHLLLELKDRITRIYEKQNALTLKNLAVNGKDLINAGIPAGKALGVILNDLFECVLEDPEMNDKEKLTEVALNIAKNMQLI
ncbi:MAG: HD domain-containing protein [Treponema sp.]|nr:HD domain-containing protein [Treponema sp.]